MLNSSEDTIVALSTPPGEGGIGVVRLSGKKAVSVADKIFKAKSGLLVRDQKTFTASYGQAVSQEAVLDEALLLLMRAPKSYTCEDVVELSLHGSPAVLTAVVESALQAGARLAEPGEFTKRAFLNGRIDLVQAEAVLDLIRARSERARQWSLSQLEGRLSEKMKEAKEELIQVLSHLEASVDFPDDELSPDSLKNLQDKILKTASNMKKLLDSSALGLAAKQGIAAAITGKPNVGKSSLMNSLLGHSRVIVTPYPGTTRDVVEDEIQVSGFPVRLLDTAGVHDTDHPIEKEGIARSERARDAADIIFLVLDSSSPLEAGDRLLMEALEGRPKIIVINKCDLPRRMNLDEVRNLNSKDPFILISCATGSGIQELENEILRFITGGNFEIPEDSVVYSSRQRDLLKKICEDLHRVVKACQEGMSPELVAVDIRLALGRLGEMVGEVVADDILDALFGQFCIGK